MIWQIISSIATLAAVVVALFLPAFQRRRRLRVELVTPGRYTKDKEASVFVTNTSTTPITIARLLYTNEKDELVQLRIDSPLPQILPPSASAEFRHPAIGNILGSRMKGILVEDSTGRRWKVRAANENRIRILLEYHIGDRFIYPSMGDVVDENKLPKRLGWKKSYQQILEERKRASSQSDNNDPNDRDNI